jgi:hypothetical protein
MALALAVIMSVSLFALSASADLQSSPLPIDIEDQLWYLDTGLDPLTDHWADPFGTEYAHDTIQEIIYTDYTNELLLVVHPQYYHDPLEDPNWEDPNDISGVFTIFDLQVWDAGNGAWVSGVLYGGIAVISANYLFNDGGEYGDQYYYKCKLTGAYTDAEGDVDILTPPTVDEVIYLHIPTEIFY